MAALLEKSLYVDDLLSGAGDNEKALEIYHKSKKIMADGGFNLRKWNSHSQTLLKSIEACEILQDQKGLVLLQKMMNCTLNRQSHPQVLKRRKTQWLRFLE